MARPGTPHATPDGSTDNSTGNAATEPARRTTAANRLARRKAQTRAALIAAAQALLAQQGRVDASIQEITEAADVGFGSFYNHFASKTELANAAVAATLQEHGALVEAITHDLADPAEVFAASVRLTCRLQRTHPQMARILLHTGLNYLFSGGSLAQQALRDLRAGADAGRLHIGDPELALATVGGAQLGVLQLLNVRPEMDADRVAEELATNLLCTFGLSRAEAHEIATRPLPPLPQPD